MFDCLSGWIGFHSTPALTPLCQEGIYESKKSPAIFTDRREKKYVQITLISHNSDFNHLISSIN